MTYIVIHKKFIYNHGLMADGSQPTTDFKPTKKTKTSIET